MSDLQIGLLAVGAIIVAAVLLFNWIQERRFRKQADAAFQTPMGDVLMQTGVVPRESHNRVEPALGGADFDTAVSEPDDTDGPHVHIAITKPLDSPHASPR